MQREQMLRVENNVNAPSMIRVTPLEYLFIAGSRECVQFEDENHQKTKQPPSIVKRVNSYNIWTILALIK